MYWINIDQINSSAETTQHSNNANRIAKPQQRWGQACVSANNRIYILGGYEGQYLGDIWLFDFQTLQYQEVPLEGADRALLSRSNHTAVYYEKHNSIYVFGGGQAQKQRYNDTLKIQIEEPNQLQKKVTTKVSKFQYSETSQVPSARTYHASCLVKNFMVVIGGEASADLKDFWALDLDLGMWRKPEIHFQDHYTPKRFHSVNVINDNQVVTFGGCHSEYVHLNEMHIFNMQNFLENPADTQRMIMCVKINLTEGAPTTRWGHAAATHDGKLYILGGRNESDINDLHEFDYAKMKWSQVKVQGQLPKPRRRHSALFISGSLIMFGGFDGSFFNDMHILDFQQSSKQTICIQPSSIEKDYFSLVNNTENADIIFQLDNPQKSVVYAHKSLILFRSIERELKLDFQEEQNLSHLMTTKQMPDFFKQVYNNQKGYMFLKGVSDKNAFVKLLEFLYCDKFVESTSPYQVKIAADIAKVLGLNNFHNLLKVKAEYAKQKIYNSLVQEFIAKQGNQNGESVQITSQQKKQLKLRADQLESQVKMDFTAFEEANIQSPEDKYEKLHNRAISNMNQCKNLDEFHDVVFYVDDTLIKANSLILTTRSDYFNNMLCSKYNFKEHQLKKQGIIQVKGIPKQYFTCIIQYIYSDHFYIQKQEAEFFIKLMIYADYFLLQRLVEICSSYLKQFVTIKNVIQIMLLAHAHNADQLEKYCLHFLTINEKEIIESRTWRQFKRQAQDSLLDLVQEKVKKEKEDSFVQLAISSYVQKCGSIHNSKDKDSKQNKLMRSQMSFKEAATIKLLDKSQARLKEDEFEFEDLLNTVNYIYLQSHYEITTYDGMSSAMKSSQRPILGEIQRPSNGPQTTTGGLFIQKTPFSQYEEEKKLPVYEYDEKENCNLLSNMKRSNDKENVPVSKATKINQVQVMPISTKNRMADHYNSSSCLSLSSLGKQKKRDVKKPSNSQRNQLDEQEDHKIKRSRVANDENLNY